MLEKIEPRMKLGKLTVISEAEQGSFGSKQWLCKCDCGNDVILKDNILRKAYINNCGCSSQFEDLTGQKFGLLTALKRVNPVLPNGRAQWLCRCDCGVEKVFSVDYLKDKRVKIQNCGHLRAPKPKPEIEPGMKIGLLTVIKEAEPGIRGGKQWLCKCDCGNDFIALDTALKGTGVRSCGCNHNFTEGDITGCKYGRLKVLYRTIDNPSGHPQFVCQCDCGNVVLMSWSSLSNGSEVPSCGCYSSEVRAMKLTKHGLVGTPLHRVWNHMRDRCNNPNDKSYHNYGGRGIYVCDRWNDKETGLEAFVADMGSTYQPGLQLDRIDNNGPYSPENCHWVSSKENNRNRRGNRLIKTVIGEKTMAEQAEVSGVKYEVYQRRVENGMPDELTIIPHVPGKRYPYEELKQMFDENGMAVFIDDKTQKEILEVIETADAQAWAIKEFGHGADEVILADDED